MDYDVLSDLVEFVQHHFIRVTHTTLAKKYGLHTKSHALTKSNERTEGMVQE
jgi:hypothetical protein